ncbi:hypothetical protein P171DRAFT_241147 [Karstenula rhodostoma CBS 690.94]|uniref:Secreted protein n=1 Tax=Karstenula rhodostoma CBS 690.94 TaxID=1392251 RepID=A0A9P4PMG5_9PLEO|nr:hypothetical protein P171DRAFT_241147 [Karstenula rhodostoma CBS 690.94]
MDPSHELKSIKPRVCFPCVLFLNVTLCALLQAASKRSTRTQQCAKTSALSSTLANKSGLMSLPGTKHVREDARLISNPMRHSSTSLLFQSSRRIPRSRSPRRNSLDQIPFPESQLSVAITATWFVRSNSLFLTVTAGGHACVRKLDGVLLG